MKSSFLILLLLAATSGGVAVMHRANAAPPKSADATVRVTRRDVGTVVKATGVVKPRVGAEVRVGSRLSGVVRRLHVQVGDRVTRDQPLAELDDRELRALREQADATLHRAEADVRYAESDLKRKAALADAHVIPADDLELAERGHSVARQQVAVARAALAYADTQLDYTRILAPIDGVVASVATQEGETVSASFAAPTFVTLIDLSRLEVWAYVDETDIGRIQVGQKAGFTVDTYGDEEFGGVVTAIYPKAEIRDNVVDYVTVVRFDPPRDRVLRPEMTTTVKIAVALRENVPALPLRAVRWEGNRAFVRVPAPAGGEAVRRWITPGARDAEFLEIVEGLREGDEVIVGNQEEP
jgi:RND family efflux transporter MFP subunit